jgi:hypothetical protein
VTAFPDCRTAEVLYNGRTRAAVGAHDNSQVVMISNATKHLMVRIMTIQTRRFPPHQSWRILSIARSTLQPDVFWAARRALFVVLHVGGTRDVLPAQA